MHAEHVPRHIILLVVIATSCYATDFVTERQQPYLQAGEDSPLIKLFKEKKSSISREGSTSSSILLGNNGIDDSRSHNDVGPNAGYEVDVSKKSQIPGNIYVKPKFQRMDEFVNLQGVKNGPKKIAGGNGDLGVYGHWQPFKQSYGDYSGDSDWSTEDSQEGSQFSDVTDRVQSLGKAAFKRISSPFEIGRYWIYPLKDDNESNKPLQQTRHVTASPPSGEWISTNTK